MEERLSSGSSAHATTSRKASNRHPGDIQPLKKRKREDPQHHNDSLQIIQARTLPESQTSQSLTLVLIANLRRTQLPLAWLDSASSTSQVPARLIFHGNLPTNPHSHDPGGEGHTVWVARQAPNGRLYAVEPLGNSYVGCLLADWVTEEQILAGRSSLSDGCLLERLLSWEQASATRRSSSRPSSQHGTPVHPFRSSPKRPKNRRGALARISIMPSKETMSISQSPHLPNTEQLLRLPELDTSQPTSDGNTAGDIIPTSPGMSAQHKSLASDKSLSGTLQPLPQPSGDPVQGDPLDSVTPDLQTILETLHRQYLETLYTSKMSLAYFAKVPLVRARTRIQSIASCQLLNLADFCRDSVIPAKKMDLKYRDSVVGVIQSLASLDIQDGAEDPSVSGTRSMAKQKSKKERKLGKDGLYPAEKEFIRSWWRGRTPRDSDVRTAESRAREMTSAVADLRIRETAMQVLLVLEALALEGAEKSAVTDQGTRPIVKDEPLEQTQDITLIKLPHLTKKKRRDLRSELDLLVDRLCIWHTVGLEDVSTSSDEIQNFGNGLETPSKDGLKDFCSDVIIPFYSARVPQQCKAICQKLGGPQISPKRPRSMFQKSLSSSRILPAASKKPSLGAIPKRTLQRVLSEDQSSRHVSPPVPFRSSTAPSVPHLKREPTEPPQRPESRGGLQRSRSFANREVDLVSDARMQNVRQKKVANLAKQRQEIDTAINALRKPNRELAAKEIADEIEKHRVGGASLTQRHGPGVQVNATPKKSKPHPVGQDIGLQSGVSATRPLPEPAANELSVLPSTRRASIASHDNGRLETSTVMRAVPTAVNDTPLRDSSKISDPLCLANGGQGFAIFTASGEAPGHKKTAKPVNASLVQATPTASRLHSDMLHSVQNTPLRMKKSQRPVLFIPLEKSDVRIENVFKDAPEIPAEAGKAMARVMGGGSEMSIYDSLGWNDDFDD